MQSVTIGKNQAGQRLDKFLHKYLPLAGNSFLYRMLRKKNITLNGKRSEGKEILREGDVIRCFFSEETFLRFSGRDAVSLPASDGGAAEGRSAFRQLSGVTVLHEDADVIVLNKPVGILSQKAEPGDLSLNEWLIGYLLERGALREAELETFRPSVCNRLDRNTSGIVLCGKSLAGSQFLSRILRERRLRKFYRTVCAGEWQEERLLEGYLKKDPRTNRVSVLPADSRDKEPSAYIRTAFRPLRTGNGFTLLEAELFTGKPHQIRAHLASIGHPVAGDGKYGDPGLNGRLRREFGLTHQLLHACRVEFPGEELPEGKPDLLPEQITAPVPELFARLEHLLLDPASAP